MHQPHDKLFKAGFSDPETTAGFLRGQLPPAVAEVIDWSSMRLEPGSFVDSQFRQSESDLLFYAPLADGGNAAAAIYLLFEHQTTEDRHLALRLLRYMVRIWENHLKSKPSASLPVILPVVLAQNDRSWALKSDFASLLEIPAGLEAPLRPFIPDFTFRLIQLAEIPFEAIAGTPAGIMILRTLKAERRGDLLADPVWDESLLVRMPRQIFELLIRYILNADVDKDGFDGRVQSIQQAESRLAAMSLAEKLRQEGMQQGMQQAIVTTLEVRLGPVPFGLVEAIREVTDPARLEALQRASLTCASFEEFAATL